MKYDIQVSHKVEMQDGRETRNDIVIHKRLAYKSILGEHEFRSLGSSFHIPYTDLPELIRKLQEKL